MRRYKLQKNENEVCGVVFTKNIDKLDTYYSEYFYIVDDGDISFFAFLKTFIITTMIKRKENFIAIVRWICYIINIFFVELGFFLFFNTSTELNMEYKIAVLIYIEIIIVLAIMMKSVFNLNNIKKIIINYLFKLYLSCLVFLIAADALIYSSIYFFVYSIVINILILFFVIIMYDFVYSLYRYHKDYCIF